MFALRTRPGRRVLDLEPNKRKSWKDNVRSHGEDQIRNPGPSTCHFAEFDWIEMTWNDVFWKRLTCLVTVQIDSYIERHTSPSANSTKGWRFFSCANPKLSLIIYWHACWRAYWRAIGDVDNKTCSWFCRRAEFAARAVSAVADHLDWDVLQRNGTFFCAMCQVSKLLKSCVVRACCVLLNEEVRNHHTSVSTWLERPTTRFAPRICWFLRWSPGAVAYTTPTLSCCGVEVDQAGGVSIDFLALLRAVLRCCLSVAGYLEKFTHGVVDLGSQLQWTSGGGTIMIVPRPRVETAK